MDQLKILENIISMEKITSPHPSVSLWIDFWGIWHIRVHKEKVIDNA